MLNWISQYQELIIKVFGAGGAGAIILAFALKKRSTKSKVDEMQTNPKISVTSSGSGIAINAMHESSVSLGLKKLTEEDFNQAGDLLGLSDQDVTVLFRLAEELGLEITKPSDFMNSIKQSPLTEALISALKKDRVAEAKSTLQDIFRL